MQRNIFFQTEYLKEIQQGMHPLPMQPWQTGTPLSYGKNNIDSMVKTKNNLLQDISILAEVYPCSSA